MLSHARPTAALEDRILPHAALKHNHACLSQRSTLGNNMQLLAQLFITKISSTTTLELFLFINAYVYTTHYNLSIFANEHEHDTLATRPTYAPTLAHSLYIHTVFSFQRGTVSLAMTNSLGELPIHTQDVNPSRLPST